MCVIAVYLLIINLNSVCTTFVLVVIHVGVFEKPYIAHSSLGRPQVVAPAVWKMLCDY